MKKLCLSFLWISCLASVIAQNTEIRVDAEKIIGQNTQFWKASGTDLLYYLAEKPSGQALLDRMDQTMSVEKAEQELILSPTTFTVFQGVG